MSKQSYVCGREERGGRGGRGEGREGRETIERRATHLLICSFFPSYFSLCSLSSGEGAISYLIHDGTSAGGVLCHLCMLSMRTRLTSL